MKTIEELCKEFADSKDLQEELIAMYEEALETFLKKHGCKATAKEYADFVKSQEEGEIDDSDVENVAGGWTLEGLPIPMPPVIPRR